MNRSINCKGKLIDFSVPKIMAIINVTPDSFYDGGKYSDKRKFTKRAEQVLHEGADIIDIGAYSSRPGAKNISEKEELERLLPFLKILSNKFPETIVSLDTFRAEIAKTAIKDFGISIINDISGGNADSKMFETVAQYNVPYILMHMLGNPQNMQKSPEYNNIIQDLIIFFSEKIDLAKSIGINDIIVDPGFGFGKTIEHNYEILKNLEKFHIFELPLLVGISRKSMIYKLLNITAEESLPHTCALHLYSLEKGANILRVHDVKEAKQIINIHKKLLNSENDFS